MLIRLFQQAPICGVGLGLADWIGPPVSHLLIGRGLAPRPEPKQNQERLRRLLGPTMAKDGLIKTGLEQIPAHETRARFSESLGTACPYTTNWGLLKQPDKHESTRHNVTRTDIHVITDIIIIIGKTKCALVGWRYCLIFQHL